MAITKTLSAEEKALLNTMCPVAQRAEIGDFLNEVQTLLAAVAGTSTVNIAAILGTSRQLDYLRLAELQLSDNEVLVFGTGVGVAGDVSMKFDGTDLLMSVVGASVALKLGAAAHVVNVTQHGILTLGVDDTGYDVKFFGATAGKYMLWDESEDALVVDTIRALATAHLELETVAVNRQVRINSRTFTGTASDSIIGMQVKPRAGDNRTAGIYGAEYEPGINEGFTGTDLIGLASRPVIKASAGTPGGNLSGDVRAFEAAVGTYDTSTRTIAGTMSALWATNNTYGTVTGGVYMIHVPAAGGGTVPWSGLAKLPDDNAMAKTDTGASLPANVAWIRVKIGATFYKIPCYNN